MYFEDYRRVPVVINGNNKDLVGWLLLEPRVADEQIINCDVSWCRLSVNQQLIEMSLVPKPRLSSIGMTDETTIKADRDLKTAAALTDEMVNDVCLRSGLRPIAVKDLLEQGWMFRQEVGEPDKWIYMR